MWTFICSCSQRSCTKVKGHLRSSCKIGWKCENGLIWKVEVWFEPNFIYWYNMEPSYVYVVKSHKSRSKVIWGQLVRWPENANLDLFAYLRTIWNDPIRCGNLDQMLTYIIHKLRWQATLAVRGPRSIFYFAVGFM